MSVSFEEYLAQSAKELGRSPDGLKRAAEISVEVKGGTINDYIARLLRNHRASQRKQVREELNKP